MTQPDLEVLFSPYGKIITSRILCDNITGMEFNILTKLAIFYVIHKQISFKGYLIS